LQVGLGILGLPLVIRDLGIVVGVLVIVIVGVIITWSDYGESRAGLRLPVIGLFKKRHPEVYTIAEYV
jgi:amino acid permease